jgi:protein-disulfide isomerase
LSVQLRSFSWRSVLDVATTLVMLSAAGAVLWFQFNPRVAAGGRPALEVPDQPLSLDGATLKGSNRADAVLILYSDFQCPFCRRFAQEVLPTLEREFVQNGKLQVAFRHFPLSIHKHAVDAGIAVECAGNQGRFWEMHDRVFAVTEPERYDFVSMAEFLNLNIDDFMACVKNEAVTGKVKDDERFGRTLGVTGTPALFLGKRSADGTVKTERVFSGAKPIEEFRSAISELLE